MTTTYGVTIDPSGAQTILNDFDTSKEAFEFMNQHVTKDGFEGFATIFAQYEDGSTDTILSTLDEMGN